MSLIFSYTTKFKKDYKLMKKRGKDLSKLQKIMSFLINGKKLDVKYKDHFLIGNYKLRRECHIEPNWLLIYNYLEENHIVFERTGSHSDLFK